MGPLSVRVIVRFHSAAVLQPPLWVRGNYFCKGRQRRRNVNRGKALPPARANLLVMGISEVEGIKKVLVNVTLRWYHDVVCC